jgi:hypothetical protein
VISNDQLGRLFKILHVRQAPRWPATRSRIRIVVFALMPAWGLANAGATLVGQNLGAQQAGTAPRPRCASRRGSTCSCSAWSRRVFVIFAYPLVSLFTSDPEALTYGARALWIVSLAFPLYAAGMCLERAFNRRRRHLDADAPQLLLLLAGQVPLAWSSRGHRRPRRDGRVHRRADLVLVLALWSAVTLQARQVEAAESSFRSGR